MNVQRSLVVALAATVSLFAALPEARAGIPECGGLRLDGIGKCEVRGSVSCEGGCSRLGIYKKACATKLTRVCRNECTLKAQPTCTDSCTESCQQRCDRGENITCTHNCYGECNGSCSTACAGKPDVVTCTASCEATCDGECDVKCGPVVDAPCYTHCIECCGGSCNAQANMDCQTTCQDKEFETCERQLEVDCKASCSAEGAIFCDGEYVLSGSQIQSCLSALTARGIANVDLRASVDLNAGTAAGAVSGKGCTVAFHGGRPKGGLFLALVALLGLGRRRSRA